MSTRPAGYLNVLQFAIRELRITVLDYCYTFKIYLTSPCMLKPQDIVLLLKILAPLTSPNRGTETFPSQPQLALHLCMSVSEVNAGIHRLVLSGLLGPDLRAGISQKKRILFPINTAF